jgi:NHLM bacteriocin system ABC transporter ATP-binding protein
LESFFKLKGSAQQLDSSHPLILTGKDGVYFVVSGKIDIFSVTMHAGEPTGRRHHVMRIESGQMMFGGRQPHDSTGLIAVGTLDTEVYVVSPDLWLAGVRDADQFSVAAGLLDNWVRGLVEGVRSKLVPKINKHLEAGKTFAVEAGDHILTAQGTLWVEHVGATSCFLDYADLPPVTTPFLLPVSQNAWLTCISAGEVRAIDSIRFLKRPTAGTDLENFNQLILNCISINRGNDDVEEQDRLTRKAAQKSHKMAYSLAELESVLSEGKSETIISKTDDLLLASCQMIGDYLNISFQAPPEASDDSRPSDSLNAICLASRVRHREIALKDRWWRHDGGPLLAYRMEDNRAVALLPISGSRYNLYDPLHSTSKKVDRPLAESLNTNAHMFYRPLPERVISTKEFFLFGFKNCGQDIRTILLMGFAAALLGLLVPISTGLIFDTIIPSASKNQLVQISIVLLSCAVATTLFEITRVVALLRVESRADIALQSAVWDRLLSLPAPFFRNYTAGDLANRGLGVNAIRQILSGVTVTAVLGGIFSLINFCLLFYYDWKLALVAAALALVGLLITVAASYRKVGHQRKVNAMEGKIFGLVLQLITGIPKLRVSGMEVSAFSVWAAQFKTQKEEAYKAGMVDCFLSTFNSGFPVFATLCIFAWVAFKSIETFSTGDFMAFNSAFANMQNGLIQMGVAMASSLSIIPYFERLKPIIQEHPESDFAKGHPGELSGEIEVKHIEFRYTDDGPPILNDVSLHVDPGEFVAVVGKSGSGKSTLVRLLLGFETPQAGTIYYNGQDLDTLDIRQVRHQIGVVLQNGQLMTGDIYRNIVGAMNLGVDDAWRAARASGLEEDIKRMPMGMNTVIGAGGATFSGGQRQRLLIARAIVGRPRILFFDEATSALDNRTQAVVSQSLEKLNSSRVVIAHRLSTIINADRIYVMDRGRIVESGSYEELMQRQGLFTAMAERQII